MMVFKDYSYIFIVTYARSGSTLLQSILNSVDGVLIRGENNNALFHLFRSISGIKEAVELGHWGREANPDEPWFGAGEIKPSRFQNTLLNSFIKNVIQPDDHSFYLGFKEIRYTPYFMSDSEFNQYMQFLLTAFPNSRIIFNMRDADSVSKSAWLAEQPAHRVKNWVAHCDNRFASFSQSSLGSDHTFLLRYEDYLSDHSILEHLFDFLGFPYHETTIKNVLAKPLLHAKRSE